MNRSSKKRVVLAEEDRKEMILDAALEVFSRSGFESSDMDRIAETAEIGKGTIYRHFPSKHDLFLALIDRGYEKLRERMGQLGCIEAPFEEKVKVGLKLYVDFFIESPEYYRVLMIEQPHHRLRLDDTKKTAHQRFSMHLINAIETGIARGELRAIDAVFAAFSLMAVASVIIERALYSKEDTRERDVESAIEIFLRGVKR